MTGHRISFDHSPSATCTGQRGFTLVELVMVIVLVGILSVFVIPRMNVTTGMADVGFRDQVRGALEFARKTAVAQRRNVSATVAGNNLILTIDKAVSGGAGALTFPNTLSLPSPQKNCASNQVCAPANVTLTSSAAVVFTPLGETTAAAATTYTVTGNSAFTITVETSGYVH